MIYPGFIGGSYVAQSPISDQEETINWYVEQLETQGSQNPLALYPTPGVTSLSTAATSPGRAHFEQDGREFAVIGTAFGEVSSTGAFTSLGTVAIDDNPATICGNGQGGGQLFITSGGNGYLYDLNSAVFSTIAALAGKATMGDQLDGYFLALDASTSTFYISNLLDGTTWDPTQFAQRSSQSDPWVALKVNPQNRYVYMLGTATSEVWFDAGTSPFPFALNPSGAIPYGCAAPFTAVVCDGSLTWLGSTATGQGMILTAAGITAQVISTFPIENAMAGYSRISNAIADTYRDLGHTFYVLTLPTPGITLSYDFNTPGPTNWQRRATWVAENNEFTYWRPMFHAFVYGQHRMLDLQTGDIYQMASTIGTDVDDRPIRRLRRAPGLSMELQRLNYSALELDMEVGLGTITEAPLPVQTTQAIQWTNQVVVEQIANQGLVQTLDGSAGGAISAQTLIGDGYIQAIASIGATAPTFKSDVYFGLGPVNPPGFYPGDYTVLSYAFLVLYEGSSKILVIYELGAVKLTTSWVAGDTLRINVSGTTVTYLKNGSLLYTSLTPATLPLAYNTILGAPVGSTLSTPTIYGDWNFIPTLRAPQVMMRSSNDGGKTWGSERWVGAGSIGEYQARVRWPRCGTARRRVFEVSVTDNIPWRILNAYLTLLQPPPRGNQVQRLQWDQPSG